MPFRVIGIIPLCLVASVLFVGCDTRIRHYGFEVKRGATN
jgi:hypothetical protein